MNMNDPFGFGKMQKMVQQTQKAVTTVQVVSAKLSENVADAKEKPILDSINKTMQAATGQLEKLGEGITKAETKTNELDAQVKAVDNKVKEIDQQAKNIKL